MTPVEQMRDPEATRLELVATLELLQPDSAQWWVYNVSHKRFLLRLYSSDASDYLMIATFRARYLCGPTSWSSPNLQFTVTPHENLDSEVQWLVHDKNANFTLKCRNLYWGQNVGWNNPGDWFAAYADPSGK